MTIRPPGLSDFTECAQVASPTVSITASTRSGSRAPDANAACAPSASADACLASVRAVAYTRRPAARAIVMHAVATPPDAPCTSTVWPGRSPDLTNSIRYAVSHAVDRHAASSKDRSAGLGTTLCLGTITYSASEPWCRSDSSERPGIQRLVAGPARAS